MIIYSLLFVSLFIMIYKQTYTLIPSIKYEYYEEAAKEDVPGYKVELAKSGRSKCSKKDCGGKIDKDSIRVGSLDKVAGSYGRWHHLECWRVPKKVQ